MTTNTKHLESARALALPRREDVLRRDPSVERFWTTNRALLAEAWAEWDHQSGEGSVLGEALVDPALRVAVEQAWDTPTAEAAVRELIHEAAPGVFSLHLFDPERLHELRSYLEAAWDAGVPLRAPYGIVLNRKGAMLDPRSAGYLAGPSFQTFYRMLTDRYLRPVARMLFPEIVGYDGQTFGFSINYRPDTDTSIRPHFDASSVTLNANINLPGEEFTGSTVDFLDQDTGSRTVLSFEPGSAMLHRGQVPHMAQPITSGERTNLVLWLFGDQGRVPPVGVVSTPIDAAQRWVVPSDSQDAYVPF
ncbi:MAG: 2OG-Fe(II) oxygenase [Actinomycetota bacterium]